MQQAEYKYNSAVAKPEREKSTNQTLLSNAQARLKEVEKSPDPVFHPLPENESLAFKHLFFPSELRILQRFSFMGQQMLVPTDYRSIEYYQFEGMS